MLPQALLFVKFPLNTTNKNNLCKTSKIKRCLLAMRVEVAQGYRLVIFLLI